jgi:hypothetical protein
MIARLYVVRLCAALSLVLSGCNVSQQQPLPVEHFKIVVTPEGKTLRLNTETGQISILTENGFNLLPSNERIRLVVGQVYLLENGASVTYQGNRQFSSDVRALSKTNGDGNDMHLSQCQCSSRHAACAFALTLRVPRAC